MRNNIFERMSGMRVEEEKRTMRKRTLIYYIIDLFSLFIALFCLFLPLIMLQYMKTDYDYGY